MVASTKRLGRNNWVDFNYICPSKKLAFKTKKQAKTFINQGGIGFGDFRCGRFYKCPLCHFFHTTSQKAK